MNVNIDRDQPERYNSEYDVMVRRLTDFLGQASPVKESLGMAISRFQPGETVREHVNKPQVEEAFIIIDGDVEFTLNGKPTLLKPLDMGFAHIGQAHSFTNVGSSTARLLSIWWRAAGQDTNTIA